MEVRGLTLGARPRQNAQMGNKRVAAVIFDLGNVMVRWDPRNLYRQLFPDTDTGREVMERFLAEIVPLDSFNQRIDLGEDVFALCEEVVAAQPHVDPSLIRAYAARQSEMWAGTIDGTVELHAALRRGGVPCYALSNWGLDFRLAETTFPVLQEFDGRVVSHEVGVVKPDPRIFEILLERFDLRADECLFIDDSAKNIVAAKELGFHTHRFTHPIRLAAHLDELGLVPLTPTGDWVHDNGALTRTLRFADFEEAWSFMSFVAEAAEQLGHHPDWSNSWNSVSVSLTTHDQGNTVTSLDRAMATAANRGIRHAVATRAEDVASRFVGHLLDDDHSTAHAMLSPSLRETVTEESLRASWESLLSPDDPFTTKRNEERLVHWPDRRDHQVHWSYVSVSGQSASEAVAVTIAMIDGQPKSLTVDAVEFGRP